jgi:hypothetical protein
VENGDFGVYFVLVIIPVICKVNKCKSTNGWGKKIGELRSGEENPPIIL